MAEKIIYFIDGFAPSEDEKLEAMSFGIKTVFRNSQYIVDGETLEHCDAVAGTFIPDSYAHLPRADELVEGLRSKMDAAAARMKELRTASASDAPPQGGETKKENTPAWGANQ